MWLANTPVLPTPLGKKKRGNTEKVGKLQFKWYIVSLLTKCV